MNETESERRARLAARVEQINADERYTPELKQYLIDEETKIAERQIADQKVFDDARASLEAEKQGVRDAAQIVENARVRDAAAARQGPNVDTLLRFQSAGQPLTTEEQEMVRRHREAEASRPETPKVWAGGPGEPNGNPDDLVLLEVGARVALLPPSKGRLNVDCSALRIELTPDDKPVPGRVIAPLKRARYHDEQDTIEVDFDSHGRAVVDALRVRFVSAPV